MLSTVPTQPLVTHNYINLATSDNTRKAYKADVAHFLKSGFTLPTNAEQILTYLQSNAPTLNPRSLKRRLTALAHWHTYQGYQDPTKDPLIHKTMRGITRTHSKPPVKASALTTDLLSQISITLQSRGSLIDLRDNALLQIGFFGAFRRSELVAIHVEHITHDPEGITIQIPRSKTDQESEGTFCALPYGNSLLCPVRALKAWLSASGITSGPIFRSITKGAQIAKSALTPHSVGLIIKSVCLQCGITDYKAFSGHSLRRGFATSASAKGATMQSIMKQGRWANQSTVMGYIEEGQRYLNNAANSLL